MSSEACVFCRMLVEGKIRLEGAVSVTLTRDSQGTAYSRVTMPVCRDHGDMPTIVTKVVGAKPVAPEEAPGPRPYDGSVNLFAKPAEDDEGA